MTDSRVLLLFNEPRQDRIESPEGTSESDEGVLKEVAGVVKALTELGISHRLAAVRDLADVGRELLSGPETCVVNLVESLDTSVTDAFLVPAVCSALGKTWTGSGTACQLLALDKWQSKSALGAAGVPVPSGIVVPPGCTRLDLLDLSTPVIVKPLRADASEGIESASVIPEPTREAVLERVAHVHAAFHQPALVEAYIPGREFNVSLLERTGQLIVLPLAEIDFVDFAPGMPRIVDYRAKWIESSFEYANTVRRVPADVDDEVAGRIRKVAVNAWKCLGCRDYARVDMRLDVQDRPWVIELNPNPDISPDAGFFAALQAGGLDMTDFVRELLANAGLALECESSRPAGSGLDVRWSERDDVQPIMRLVEATAVFRPCELDVAREILCDAVAAGATGHYQSYTAELDGAVVGWICFGPTPCAAGTFDLYWLAVRPAHGGRGIGAALLARAEKIIRALAGRLIVAETSARPDYEAARQFYERHDFKRASTVDDFYETGDAKLIYVKTLA